jgi:lambda repressor-like predicted transcriptional regulator
MPSPPIDLVVMSLSKRGASIEEIARRAGLSPCEAKGALVRVASRFGPPYADRRQPVEA